jgi:hypothetical protein
MKRKQQYIHLMEKILESHREFSQAWNEAKQAELKRRGIKHLDQWGHSDREWAQILEANDVAYRAARLYSDRRDEYMGRLFEQLPNEDFVAGEPQAIDASIDFLEIDILAFRCGYIKELCLRKLKSLPINPIQAERLRQLTLALCQGQGQRRELKELARLMIRLADESLVHELKNLLDQHPSEYVRRKASRTLQVIRNGRPDLR